MRAGDIIADRFEVELLAGSGGVGQVYRARDRVSGSAIALKVLKPPSARDIERFAREARVLARLRHPAIVRYVAHGRTAEGEPYMAMEWLDGEDLAARLSRQPLTFAESAAVVRRAAEALAVAHSHGIVHRDIKPSNLFLRNGRLDDLKLLDFGLARLTDASRELTHEGLVVGTLGYMAPEQAAGEREIDARCDVFALGCVLYRCLTGRAPFDSDRIGAVLMKILHDDPPGISQLVPDVPGELEELVGRMLAKDPAARPACGAAVAHAIDEIYASIPASSGRQPPPPAITHTERRFACFVAVGKPADWLSPASSRLLVLFDVGSDRIEQAREIAERHGGQLEPLADGSMLVALGAAASATDLASQAARCALELRALLPSAPMAVAMGRSDQSSTRFAGTAIDIAAQMLSGAEEHAGDAAPPIRIDATSAGLLDPSFEVGGGEAGLVLLGERQAVEKPRLLLGKPTPCVGRERELAALTGMLEECVAEGVARIALVTGPPGCGKSRVRRELMRALRERHDTSEIWCAAGQPIIPNAPFTLLCGLVRSAARLGPDDSASARRQKLAARVQRHLGREEAARIAAFLGEIAGAPGEEHGDVGTVLRAARANPALMAEAIRRAWLDLLAAELAAAPLVLMLEDLHWGDRSSVGLISAAVRRLHDSPLLVVGFARPEVRELFPKLSLGGAVHEIRLGELTPRASERLLRAVVADSMDQQQIAAIVERAGGNPFYLEEMLRAAAAGCTGALPETVLAMVQARLLPLDPSARRVLRAASVFGPRFHIAGVRALLGETEASDALSHWIDVLIEAEMIEHPSGAWDDAGEMVFRHALVCEAVYETLPDPDRRLGHRLAGAWLEQSEHADSAVVARHFTLAGEHDRAAAWHLITAEAALQRADFASADAAAQLGVDCGAAGEQLGALRAVQMQACLLMGNPGKAEPYLREVPALIPEGSARWCNASGLAAVLASFLGRWDDVLQLGGAILPIEPSADTLEPYLIALASLATILVRIGVLTRAAPFIARIALLAPRLGEEPSPARGWIDLLHAHRAAVIEGDPWQQRERALSAVASFGWARDRTNWGAALVQAAAALSSMGAYTEAVSVFEQAIEKLVPAGVITIAALARGHLALALAHLGRAAESRAVLDDGLRAAAEARNLHVELVVRRCAVQALLLAGDVADAEAEARRFVLPYAAAAGGGALPRPPAEIQTITEVEAGIAVAQVHAAAGRHAEALAWTSAALRSCEARGGSGSLEAQLRLSHAEALAASGQREAAAAALARARARLLERAEKIADPARRRSFLEDVPENRRTLAAECKQELVKAAEM